MNYPRNALPTTWPFSAPKRTYSSEAFYSPAALFNLTGKRVEELTQEDVNLIASLAPPVDWMLINGWWNIFFNERRLQYPNPTFKAIYNYIGSNHAYINRRLWNTRKITDPDAISIQKLILEMAPCYRDFTLFRHTSLVLDVGEHTLGGFLSCHYNYSKADRNIREDCLWKIHVTKGTPCLYIGGDEWEVILPHLTVVEVESVSEEVTLSLRDGIVKEIKQKVITLQTLPEKMKDTGL